MKLRTIANRYYLVTLFLIFSLGSLVAYLILKSIINREFNEKLFAEQEQLTYELRTYENLQKTYYLNIGDVIEINEVETYIDMKPQLRDTVMYDPYEKKALPFRQLTFSDNINGKNYVITISKSLLPNQDLIEGVSEIMGGIALILMVSLGLLNRVIFLKLWAPFHQIVRQLGKFNITRPIPLKIDASNVDEFDQLSKVLDEMINKSINDYKNLREFTENTSHEIQTPLAIIKNKAEMLLQEPLTRGQLEEIGKIYEAARRLSRLKEGLSLITKIENNQFISSQTIDLRAFLEQKLADFEELLDIKQIQLETKFNGEPLLRMNNDLAYIMFTNLINNAIKHNIYQGKIWIELWNESFEIYNTGAAPTVPIDQLFDRFKRSSSDIESTGLGLSLIKKIAEKYEMQVDYTYSSGMHRIRIDFVS